MSKRRTGLVVGKDFRPPEGAQPRDWCYLTIDLSEKERLSVRVSRDQVDKAGVGDVVAFRPPRGDHPLHRVVRLGSDPALLPPAAQVQGRHEAPTTESTGPVGQSLPGLPVNDLG